MIDPTSTAAAAATPAGRTLLQVDAGGTALFALSALLAAALVRPWTAAVGVAVALTLFVAGCLAFLAGYARAIQRSRTDDISVASLFLLSGPAVPAAVKRQLWLLFGAQVVVALATAAWRPFTTLAFGVLAPMLGLGLNGLWAARHGRFPPRPASRTPPSAAGRSQARTPAPTAPGPPTRAPRTDPSDPHPDDEMEQNARHG